MCLAIPGKIISIKKQDALVNFRGIQKQVNVSLVSAEPGDYVIVHAGFAVEKMDKNNARETYKYFDAYAAKKREKNS